jgi:hypothetical protein
VYVCTLVVLLVARKESKMRVVWMNDGPDSMRVWVEGWPADMFEVFSREDFYQFHKYLVKLGIPVIEQYV